MSIHHGWRSHTENFDVLENQDRNVIAAGHPEPITKQMGLDLSKIKYYAKPTQKRRVKNHNAGFFEPSTVKADVPRSKEEMFQLENLSPATHSDMMTNTYTLNVNTKFDGGCCVDGPSLSVPLTIIPLSMESYAFDEPAGYQPFQLGIAQIHLNSHLYF